MIDTVTNTFVVASLTYNVHCKYVRYMYTCTLYQYTVIPVVSDHNKFGIGAVFNLLKPCHLDQSILKLL